MKCFATSCFVLLAALAITAQADFILWNDEQITVDSVQGNGILYEMSCAFIVPGGSVSNLDAYDSSTVDVSGDSNVQAAHVHVLNAYDSSTIDISGGANTSVSYLCARGSSTVDMSGGAVSLGIQAHGSSTVDMSGGTVSGGIYAYDSSTVDMSGGTVISTIQAHGSSTVDMSGGSVQEIYAIDSSTVTLRVRDFYFRPGEGLSLDGERILGEGILTGEWMDDPARWEMYIAKNSGAGIFISPVVDGDANCDGVVDVSDLGILATNYGTGGGAQWSDADFTGDGIVDVSDLGVLASHYGNGSAAVASVPEPGTITLLLCGLAGLALIRRR